VVGGGVSGITAGYVLSRTDRVTLFEADDRLGGHADTHPTGVDTGFIVYNERTYPLLTRLFAELGVATQPSRMSMSVRCAGCGLQYAGQRGLPGLAAGLPRGRGRYVRMLAEVPRFHRAARRLLDHCDHDGQVLADFLRTGGFSRYFTAHFALPLVAAVWSCPTATALRPGGRLLIQQMSRTTRRGGGPFIESYIAPDMDMRPVGETIRLIQDAGFEVLGVEAMREHYARTIRAWLENFEANLPAITTILTAEQVRVWRLYLAGGALAFEQGRMGVDQILAVKPQGPSR